MKATSAERQGDVPLRLGLKARHFRLVTIKCAATADTTSVEKNHAARMRSCRSSAEKDEIIAKLLDVQGDSQRHETR